MEPAKPYTTETLLVPQLENVTLYEEIRRIPGSAKLIVLAFSLAAVAFVALGGFLAILWATAGIFIVVYGAIERARRERLMRAFAELNGLKFLPDAGLESFSADFFFQGHSQKVSHVISGVFNRHPIRFFTFEFTTGSGKRKTKHYNAGIEASLDVSIPSLIISPNTWSDYEPHQEMEPVLLEGNFGEHFHVWAGKGMQREAREVLTPDEMSYLIDHARDYTIEFHRDKIYLFKRDYPINSPEELQNIISVIRYLLSEWSPVVKRILN
ncbi:MAG: hypothetical protein HY471_02875 [Candidatus Sungbacteria bacterium]|nr:hypothetical protein [Candidatus Sungbacteria bacterium]